MHTSALFRKEIFSCYLGAVIIFNSSSIFICLVAFVMDFYELYSIVFRKVGERGRVLDSCNLDIQIARIAVSGLFQPLSLPAPFVGPFWSEPNNLLAKINTVPT